MSRARRRERYVKKVSETPALGALCEHTGKVRHVSRKAANRYARRNNTHGVDAYLCTACGEWHLGHLPKMVRDGDAVRWSLQPRIDTNPESEKL